MDNYRLILFVALAFISMLLWQAWQKDYGAKPAAAQQQKTTVEQTASADATPTPITDGVSLPSVSSAQPAALPAASVSGGKRIIVDTDLLKLEINTKGGTISKAWLKDYSVSLEQPDVKVQLLTDEPSAFFVAQSGLLASEKGQAPTHESEFNATQSHYTLTDGSDELNVDLVWKNEAGVSVTKRYLFKRGDYRIRVQHIVDNQSAETWNGREYSQLQRVKPVDHDNMQLVQKFLGATYYTPEEKYTKLHFSDIAEKKLDIDVTGGWVAMIQHYFISAWVPQPDKQTHFYTKALPGERYVIGAYGPAQSLAAGQQASYESSLVIAPKLQDQLAAIAPGLDLNVDYGWLTVIAQPVYWVLKQLHDLLGNWGWAIIGVTLIIKLLFYKLSEASYRSMANMRKVAPRLQALKDRYGDDKQRMNQAMMELYKTEKINPLGGCLPMIVQIPVFIALYWVLLESVELRQAPWILWIQDLSIMDPYFVLPLLMGVSMFIQQKLNPPPPDPMQAKIMQALPVVFTVFFAFFPAGLVLYWFVNNLLSIAQQWHITRAIEKGAEKARS